MKLFVTFTYTRVVDGIEGDPEIVVDWDIIILYNDETLCKETISNKIQDGLDSVVNTYKLKEKRYFKILMDIKIF